MRRKYSWKVLLFLTFQATIIVRWFWRKNQDSYSPQDGAEVVVVLFWNDVHDTHGRWFITPDRWIGPEGLRTCPMLKSASENGKFSRRQRQRTAQCFFTSDDSHLTRADAVVVSGQHDNNLKETDIPEQRSPSQAYVFYSAEAPSHRWKTKEDYGDWLGAFNWTATYRRDSDVPLLYGAMEKIRGASVTTAALNQNVVDAISQKNSSVAAIISHCHDRLLRTRLIKQLKETGLKIDIYGSCGTIHEVCPPLGQDCYSTLSKHYRFFLSFENSLCDDYVTEKLFKALQHPWVPIVFGGVNYSHVAPPKSVIQATLADDHGASDLPENGLINHHGKKLKPWHVVELVRLLEQNQTLYLKYFDWKNSYRVIHPIDAGCALCRKLSRWKQSNRKARKIYKDIHDWWENGARCV